MVMLFLSGWNLVFGMVAVVAFIGSVFIAQNSAFKLPRIWLAYLSWALGFILCVSIVSWTDTLIHNPHVIGLLPLVLLTVGPAFYLYTQYQIMGYKKSYWIHFIVPVLLCIAYFPILFHDGKGKIRAMDTLLKSPMGNVWFNYGEALLFMASLLFYTIFSFMQFRSLASSVSVVYHWLFRLTFAFSMFVFSILVYYILVWTNIINPLLDHAISMNMAMFLILTLFVGLNEQLELSIKINPAIEPKYQTSNLTPEASGIIAEKLKLLMKREKLYLDPDLSLSKLADHLGSSRHVLSQILNDQLKLRFFDYINNLRIQEAISLMSDKKYENTRIIEIAMQCGFNNKASFNVWFKKITHQTPTEYRENAIVKESKISLD